MDRKATDGLSCLDGDCTNDQKIILPRPAKRIFLQAINSEIIKVNEPTCFLRSVIEQPEPVAHKVR